MLASLVCARSSLRSLSVFLGAAWPVTCGAGPASRSRSATLGTISSACRSGAGESAAQAALEAPPSRTTRTSSGDDDISFIHLIALFEHADQRPRAPYRPMGLLEQEQALLFTI